MPGLLRRHKKYQWLLEDSPLLVSVPGGWRPGDALLTLTGEAPARIWLGGVAGQVLLGAPTWKFEKITPRYLGPEKLIFLTCQHESIGLTSNTLLNGKKVLREEKLSNIKHT